MDQPALETRAEIDTIKRRLRRSDSGDTTPQWVLRIQDPIGNTRLVPAPQAMATVGNSYDSTIALKDPRGTAHAAWIVPPPPLTTGRPRLDRAEEYWLKVPEGAEPARVGDLDVREARLLPGVPVRLGQSRVTLELNVVKDNVPPTPSGLQPWLTCSVVGTDVLWLTQRAAATPLAVYFAGETGVGKEVLAHLSHAWSERASGPFVPLHCAALPISLIESELFGHVKGAFTGALHHRAGALLQAHGGTLFLDEIGDLPPDIQIKLLRFLENGEIRPVGADRTSRANVRLLCATHRPLLELVESGQFRRDLYYRLASVTIPIPPLRARPEDIDMLATRYASGLARSISPEALTRLRAHSWPGNVRELRHAIERAVGLSDPYGQTLHAEAFDFLLTRGNVLKRPELELGSDVIHLDEMERLMISRAMRLAHGHRGRAADLLGIARSTLFVRLKRYGLLAASEPADPAELDEP